jgi:hypothetical protein
LSLCVVFLFSFFFSFCFLCLSEEENTEPVAAADVAAIAAATATAVEAAAATSALAAAATAAAASALAALAAHDAANDAQNVADYAKYDYDAAEENAKALHPRSWLCCLSPLPMLRSGISDSH